MVTKFVLLHFVGIFLLITKLNAVTVSEANVLQTLESDNLGEFGRIESNNSFIEETILKSDENVTQNLKLNTSDANCRQIFQCYGYDIHVMYHYYNRAFQVILFLLFGIELKLTKVKAVARNPIGPGIASFCCWIFAPLVSTLKTNALSECQSVNEHILK